MENHHFWWVVINYFDWAMFKFANSWITLPGNSFAIHGDSWWFLMAMLGSRDFIHHIPLFVGKCWTQRSIITNWDHHHQTCRLGCRLCKQMWINDDNWIYKWYYYIYIIQCLCISSMWDILTPIQTIIPVPSQREVVIIDSDKFI